MTREEAIKILKSKMDGHTDTSYEWAETVRMAIKALEQESILDKIRAEIDRQYKWLTNTRYTIRDVDIAFGSILQIIDKYKAESEDKE